MTWIRTISLAEANEQLRKAVAAQQALFPPEYAAPAAAGEAGEGDTAGIVASHSLIPDALYHAFATFGVLMSADLPLSRRQHEMIGIVVSVANHCHY
jgi:hypothetical protein